MLNIEKIYKETKNLDELFSLQYYIMSPEIIQTRITCRVWRIS